MSLKPIGAYIRRRREMRGLTPKELAFRLRLKEGELQAFENDEAYPDTRTLEKLSKELLVSVSELVSAEDETEDPDYVSASPKLLKVRRNVAILAVLGVGMLLAGYFLKVPVLMVLSLLEMLGMVVYRNMFYKCPRCGTVLPADFRPEGKCPHCRKEI